MKIRSRKRIQQSGLEFQVSIRQNQSSFKYRKFGFLVTTNLTTEWNEINKTKGQKILQPKTSE